MSGVKIHGYFIAGAENHVLVVRFAHQVGDVAEARVISDLARVGARRADVLVDVGKIVLRIAFDDARIAAELQLGFGQRNFGKLELGIFRRIIHADAIPINSQIRGDANEARAGRNSSGEVGDHGAREAGREAHVVNHLRPIGRNRPALQRRAAPA